MKEFNLKEYIGNNPLLKEAIDFPEMEDEFEGAMDAMVVEPEVYLQDIINASSEEIVSDDYYEIMNAVEQGVYSAEEAVKLAKAWAQDKLSGLAENKPIKEDGQWDDKWLPSFDDLKNRAKQIKGFEDMGKYGFTVPHQHGEIEIEPIDRLGGDVKSVEITWIYPDGEYSQVKPLITGYKAIDQAIRSSQDKTDWKRMAGLEEDEIPIKEYSWDDEEEEGATQSVDDIYSEYTSRDGWNKDALEDVGLMELISEIERLAYEVRNARRGSYAKFGDTGEELKTYLEELGRSFTQISNNM